MTRTFVGAVCGIQFQLGRSGGWRVTTEICFSALEGPPRGIDRPLWLGVSRTSFIGQVLESADWNVREKGVTHHRVHSVMPN